MKNNTIQRTVLLFIVIAASFVSRNGQAQSLPVTLTPPDSFGWRQTLNTMLTLTQASYKDWVQGGDDAFAFTGTLIGKTIDDESLTNWTTSYNFAFGKTSLDNLGTRKTTDIIDAETVYSYKLDSLLHPYISATLLTQFAPGFTYDDSNRATEVSKFFDPGYLTQGAGIGFLPWRGVKERLGVAMREIVTSQFTQYANVTGGPQTNKVRVDGGFQSTTEINWMIDSNIVLTASLALFDPVRALGQVVVYSNNTLTAKVSKYISVGLNVDLINERDISTRTQIAEGLGLNLSYAIFGK